MQAFNPYMPNWEYVPDGEPYVFGDRLYVFGSHDKFDGAMYCENDYVGWSAPVDDLGDWKYEGVIYKKSQDPDNADLRAMNAPDVQRGPDGRYYLYYFLGPGQSTFIGVAVCDTPAGAYEYYGKVHYPDGTLYGQRAGDPYAFDPGLFTDDDGTIYLYTGFTPMPERRLASIFGEGICADGSYAVVLGADMLTVQSDPVMVAPGVAVLHAGGFEGHEFFEAGSMRKIGGRYYFVYSSINSHELCYAAGESPTGPFTFGGTIVSNGDVYLRGDTFDDAIMPLGNTHGGLVTVKNEHYVFYHRQTNMHQFSRQACAERIQILPDGRIPQVEVTSCGLNGGPLAGRGAYGAYITCHLRGARGVQYYHADKIEPEDYPFLTQEGSDRTDTPNQYITNIQNGAEVGYKYFRFENVKSITLRLRGKAKGAVLVQTGSDAGSIPFAVDGAEWMEFTAPIAIADGVTALYFIFEMEGSCDFDGFTLS